MGRRSSLGVTILLLMSLYLYFFHWESTTTLSDLQSSFNSYNYPPSPATFHLPTEESEREREAIEDALPKAKPVVKEVLPPPPPPAPIKPIAPKIKKPEIKKPEERPVSKVVSNDNPEINAHMIPTPNALHSALVPGLRWLSNRKILSYDEALLFNSKCKNSYKQSNQDQINGSGEEWKTMEASVLKSARKDIIDKVIKVFGFEPEVINDKVDDIKGGIISSLSSGDWNLLFGNGGRGIVYTAGNKDTSSRLLTSLKILRSQGCILPVEIWGFKDEIALLGELKTTIEAQKFVTFRELTHSEAQPGAWKQFQVKGEAIARSTFSEVLYLDSDNIAIRDPTYLFDAPLYKENGVVLWPDITKDSAANPIYRITGKECSPHEWQVETGQILISKLARGGLNLAALLIAEQMNQAHEFWYKFSGGDKDTFRYAFHFLDIPFTPAPYWLSLAGSVISTFEGHTFCGHTMLHFGLSPVEWIDLIPKLDSEYHPPNHAPPLFVHTNLLKHSGYNNQHGNTFRSIKSATPDTIASSISQLLKNDIRGKVYNHRGMCTDIWDSATEIGEAEVGQTEGGVYDKGRVAITSWIDSWGGLLRGFEDMFYNNGGTAGAW